MFFWGRHQYKSKEELKKKLKDFLAKAPEGPVTHPTLVEKLRYLLLLHPDYDRKEGSGILRFEVQRNRFGAGSSFCVYRTDGSHERFSYKKCLDGQISTKRSKAIEAFRFLTRPQMMEFRESIKLPTQCKISGKTITSNEELEIDHQPEFSELLTNFCILKKINLEKLDTLGSGEHLKLIDHHLACEFIRYHSEKAILHPVLKSEHRALRY
jgi:hypothetical protein